MSVPYLFVGANVFPTTRSAKLNQIYSSLSLFQCPQPNFPLSLSLSSRTLKLLSFYSWFPKTLQTWRLLTRSKSQKRIAQTSSFGSSSFFWNEEPLEVQSKDDKQASRTNWSHRWESSSMIDLFFLPSCSLALSLSLLLACSLAWSMKVALKLNMWT